MHYVVERNSILVIGLEQLCPFMQIGPRIAENRYGFADSFSQIVELLPHDGAVGTLDRKQQQHRQILILQ